MTVLEGAVRLSPEEYRRVLTFFEKAVEEEPTRWSYWCDIGFCQGKLGQWREAAAALERIADKAEVTATILSLLGYAYLKLARYQEAETTLARAYAGVTAYRPVPPFVAKVADVERMQMLVESPSRAMLQRMLADWLPALHGLRAQHKGLLRWAVDVDPLAI